MNPVNALLAILPASWAPYAKAVVAALSVALYFAAELVPFLPAGVAEWVQGAVLLLGALGVYATPNEPQLELGHKHEVDPEPED